MTCRSIKTLWPKCRRIGNLVIEDRLEDSGFKRPVRYDRLRTEAHLVPADLIPPLLETVIKMTANPMTLIGCQIGACHGLAVHYLQARAVRMTNRTE